MNCVLFTLIFVVSTTSARGIVTSEEKEALYAINELLEGFLKEIDIRGKIKQRIINLLLDKIMEKASNKLGSLLQPIKSLVDELKKTAAEAVEAPREAINLLAAKIRNLQREIKEGVQMIPLFSPFGNLKDVEIHIQEFLVTTQNRLKKWGNSLKKIVG